MLKCEHQTVNCLSVCKRETFQFVAKPSSIQMANACVCICYNAAYIRLKSDQTKLTLRNRVFSTSVQFHCFVRLADVSKLYTATHRNIQGDSQYIEIIFCQLHVNIHSLGTTVSSWSHYRTTDASAPSNLCGFEIRKELKRTSSYILLIVNRF